MVGASVSCVSKARVVHGFSVLIQGVSLHHVTLTGLCLQGIKVLFVKVLLRVFNLSCKLLYRLSHPLLKSFFEEEKKHDEHKDVEDKQ